MVEINAAQIAQVIIGAIIIGMVGMVFRRLGKVETALVDFRLKQVTECSEYRQKIIDRINGKTTEVRKELKDEITDVHSIRGGTNPGIHSPDGV